MRSFLIAAVGISALMLIWVIVQTAWRNLFSDTVQNEDSLSGRIGCTGCDCVDVCEEDNEEKQNSGFFEREAH